jgi:hypothetical protein
VQRKCARCGVKKPLIDFAGVGKTSGKIDCYCRPCRAEYGREHYEANRQRYIDQAQTRKGELRTLNYQLLLKYLRTHPCVDCGETDVLVLEFDHLGGKSFGIATALRDRSWPDILVEIGKCDVRCANCHRRRTAQRGGWARFVAAQLTEPEEPPAPTAI